MNRRKIRRRRRAAPFWKALKAVSVLDPTCGSGAFLFAALNILEPLYNACLDAMRGFLDDLRRSRRKHRPEKLRDLREALAEVDRHASERYAILKSIVIGNLYGVDIMEEAVEICKLRLFLKLVAQLERYDQIEPLPDIDFNVRAGNTLVGFASLEEVKRALSANLIKQLSLPDIEERAEIADRAFRRFRAMQTEHVLDAGAFTDAKAELRRRLDDLRDELDGYLAGDYGVKSKATLRRWRASHQPFHWFVEFYGVMHRGGFEVIIGNPPYVQYRKVEKSYRVLGFRTLQTGDLYAYTLERTKQLVHRGGRLGLIVPLSFVSSNQFAPLRELFCQARRPLWLSHFSNRPGQLFYGAQNRLTIVISGNTTSRMFFSTKYCRWTEKGGERTFLLDVLEYTCIGSSLRDDGFYPKVGSRDYLSILGKLHAELTVRAHLSKAGRHGRGVHWVRVPGYFCQFFLSPPMTRPENGGQEKTRGEVKTVHPIDESARHVIHALLNSTTYYLFFDAHSDGRHINPADVYDYPLDLNSFDADVVAGMERLSSQLRDAMMKHKTERRKSGLLIDSVDSGACKSIIDRIDGVLAQHYGFTDQELDFIINYDIKYRMGREMLGTG